jgi:hypothetical protein
VSFSLPASSVPSRIEVSVNRAVGAQGAFVSGVRLRERITTTTRGVIHWRTAESLPPGRYYVHVSGMDLAGVVDCSPHGQLDCLQEWSNVLRVVVPRT